MKKSLILGWVVLAMGVSTLSATEGLVAYWPFDRDFTNAEGTAAFDGIPVGTAEISAEDVKVGAGALKIADDTTTASHVVTMGDFVGSAPVVSTVVGWYKYLDIDGDGSDVRNFIWETQPTYSLSFAIRDGGGGKTSQWYFNTATGSINGFGPEVDDGLWHHAAVVWNSVQGYIKYYHDGALLTTVEIATSNNPVLAQAGFNIGTHRSADGGRNWDGYLDEIAIFSIELSENEISDLYNHPKLINPLNIFGNPRAVAPTPEDGAVDVNRDVVLSWAPGEFAKTHNVVLGTSFDDVNDATLAEPKGVVLGQGLSDVSIDAGRLDFGQTYYWRVDEVNGAPDFTVYKGVVFSFEVEPLSVPISNITATASSSFGDSGPEKTIDGSGLVDDLHGVSAADMWFSAGIPATIEYAFDQAYRLHELWIWNSNQLIEAFVGFGAKEVVIEHSLDGENWTVLEGVGPLAQATGGEGYAHNSTLDFGGTVAQHVRMTINSLQGIAPQASLSEVRFYSIPTFATRPNPASGATDVSPDVTLAWGKDGREAGSHDVYVGTDSTTLSLAGSVSDSSFDTLAVDLQLSQTYYWRVDEVNDAMDPSTWTGDVWSFSTAETIVIDDMESYKDEEFLEIWATWIDGFADPANNGALVGANPGTGDFSPESTTVHGGNKSLPIHYDNGGAAQSEATRTFAVSQDWTRAGVTQLVVWFHGAAGNTGQLYLKVNGTKIPYEGPVGNIGLAAWQAWSIDLAGLGMDLRSVRSLAVGVEGNGATGTLYIDDIALEQSAPEAINEWRVSASSDDAEEKILDGGVMDLTSSDLELGHEGDMAPANLQTIGCRWVGIAVPRGATITEAWVQFSADDIDNPYHALPVSLVIEGQLSPSPDTFAATAGSISARATTTANVVWDIPQWMTVHAMGPEERSPDISSIIQEIVNQPDWSGEAIVLLFADNPANPSAGAREAESFDGSAGEAPLLHISFE